MFDTDSFLVVNNKFNVAVVNSLWRIMTSKRLGDVNDPKLLHITKLLNDLLVALQNPVFMLSQKSPPLFYAIERLGITNMTNTCLETYNVALSELEEHKDTFQVKSHGFLANTAQKL